MSPAHPHPISPQRPRPLPAPRPNPPAGPRPVPQPQPGRVLTLRLAVAFIAVGVLILAGITLIVLPIAAPRHPATKPAWTPPHVCSTTARVHGCFDLIQAPLTRLPKQQLRPM